MPRDGRISRERILASAREEFLAHGFEGASIRAIAARAGLTSAALYRHFASKEDLFAAVVAPSVDAVNAWMDDHERTVYTDVETGDIEDAASRSQIDMMRDVVFPQRDLFKLLLCSAKGTSYENFQHDLVMREQEDLARGLAYLRSQGFPANEVDERTLHMMLSAFVTALFEPVVHDYPEGDAMQYYETMERFFLPGWHDILGI